MSHVKQKALIFVSGTKLGACVPANNCQSNHDWIYWNPWKYFEWPVLPGRVYGRTCPYKAVNHKLPCHKRKSAILLLGARQGLKCSCLTTCGQMQPEHELQCHTRGTLHPCAAFPPPPIGKHNYEKVSCRQSVISYRSIVYCVGICHSPSWAMPQSLNSQVQTQPGSVENNRHLHSIDIISV